jgi:PEP-CTERM motif
MKKIFLVISFLAYAWVGSAHAVSQLGIDPPSNLIVTSGGQEWVWAAPCAPINPSCGVVQLHHNFHIPSVAEWNTGFPNVASLIAAFDNPQTCASPYFSTLHNHCDSTDLNSAFVWGAPWQNASFGRDNPAYEGFLVRGIPDSASVPEPATMILFGAGLFALFIRQRIRS